MKRIVGVAACGLCLAFVLIMGAGTGVHKARLEFWSNEPEPTLDHIYQTPAGAIMMGGDDRMHLGAAGPEDWDTRTTTEVGSSRGWDIHNYWPLVDPWPEDENPA